MSIRCIGCLVREQTQHVIEGGSSLDIVAQRGTE